MDPFSIATGSAGLAFSVAQAIKSISNFLGDARAARKDMDAVSRELLSIQLCLEALEADGRLRGIEYPADLTSQLKQILVNVEYSVQQIKDLMNRLTAGKFGRRIQWAWSEKDEANKLRSSLESSKTTLEIALSIGTISMLSKQNTVHSATDSRIAIVQDDTTKILNLTNTVDQKIDTLTDLHKNDERFEAIRREVVELRGFLGLLRTSNTQSHTVSTFTHLTEQHTKSMLEPLPVYPEQKTELLNILERPMNQLTLLESAQASSPSPNRAFASAAVEVQDVPYESREEKPEQSSDYEALVNVQTADVRLENSGHHAENDSPTLDDTPTRLATFSPPISAMAEQPKSSDDSRVTGQQAAASLSELNPYFSMRPASRSTTPTLPTSITHHHAGPSTQPMPFIEFKVSRAVLLQDQLQLSLQSLAPAVFKTVMQPDHAPDADEIYDLMGKMLRRERRKGPATFSNFQLNMEESINNHIGSGVAKDALLTLNFKKYKPPCTAFMQLGRRALKHLQWSDVEDGSRFWLMVWDKASYHKWVVDYRPLLASRDEASDPPLLDPASQKLVRFSFYDDEVIKRVVKQEKSMFGIV